jgi:hypothetical protein
MVVSGNILCPSGIAGTGPMPPFLSTIEDPARLRAIAAVAVGLRALADNPAKFAAAQQGQSRTT